MTETITIAIPSKGRLMEKAEELFAGKTTDEWIATLQAAGYPCGPYHLPHQALADPQVRANDFAVELEHPTFGTYTTIGMPVSFEKSPSGIAGPSPGFAADTVAVLAEAGLSPDRIEELVASGIVIAGLA